MRWMFHGGCPLVSPDIGRRAAPQMQPNLSNTRENYFSLIHAPLGRQKAPRLIIGLRQGSTRYVHFWRKADIGRTGDELPLLTQIGHWVASHARGRLLAETIRLRVGRRQWQVAQHGWRARRRPAVRSKAPSQRPPRSSRAKR